MFNSPATEVIKWDPVLSGITQTLCIYAIILGSKSNLRRWLAVSSLTVPELPDDFNDESATSLAPLTGWRRMFNKVNAQKLVAFVIAGMPSLFVWVILPRIKSQIVQDAFWIILSALTYFGMLHVPIGLMFPPKEKTIQYKPSTITKRGYALHQEANQMKYVRGIAAAALTLAGMASTYFGYKAMVPLGAATWVVGMAATYTLPKITMRYMVVILNGYILSIPILTDLMVLAIEVFQKVTGSSDKPSAGGGNEITMMPSAWIINLLMPFTAGLPSMVVGVMLSMALRYDYSRSAPVSLPGGPGEAVAIPRKVDSFPQPTFNAGLNGLVASLVVMTVGAMYLPPDMPMVLEFVAVLVTIPVSTITMFLSVWRRGEVASWWKYEECWIPQPARNVPTKADVEAAPASDNEKASLHPSA